MQKEKPTQKTKTENFQEEIEEESIQLYVGGIPPKTERSNFIFFINF